MINCLTLKNLENYAKCTCWRVLACASMTAPCLRSDRSIVRQFYRQHVYDMHSKISFIFFQINDGNIEIHTVLQSDSNNIGLFSFLFFFSVLCRSVGLSGCQTIDIHPSTFGSAHFRTTHECVFLFIF